jgi:hypothetical protein
LKAHQEEKEKMKVKIYGCSDDLIEMEGDLQDEFGSYRKPGYLTFSDGTIVKASYGKTVNGHEEGIWQVGLIGIGQLVSHVLTPCFDGDADPYSDVLELEFASKVKLLQFTNEPTEPVTPVFVMACEIDSILRDVYGQDLSNGYGNEKKEWLKKLTEYLKSKGVK